MATFAKVYMVSNTFIEPDIITQLTISENGVEKENYVDLIHNITKMDKNFIRWQLNQVICCFDLKHNITFNDILIPLPFWGNK